MPTHILEDVA